ncbi:S8 family serine peptidase [Flaviflexus sp.]|uniref:S8 family serine peptidase n=1 Tax=Flaviflexus sp. TaxID=1969482 RepID=UPI003F910ECD
MTSHVPGSRRTLRACIATLGAGALGLGAFIVPAAATPSADPIYESDPSVLVGSSANQASVAGSAYGSRATGEWFVSFSSAPLVNGGTQARVNADLNELESAIADLDVEVKASHSELWAGAVVTADDAELAKVLDRVDVAGVFPVLLIDAPEQRDLGAEPEMRFAAGMTGADFAQDLGVSGYGQTISIIDTGVDIDHVAFGGTGVADTTPWSEINGNGSRIIGGYDFVGDDYNANPAADNYNPVPAPDSNPDDCQGHGTHVAGIAAGSDDVTGVYGVAPDANILAYRVFGCEGSTDSAIMLQAMEASARDGADIVNMSIGAGFMTWPNYPTAVAADNLVDAGVVVAVSQGNEGESGVFSGGAPAVASKVISVGSVDNVASEAPVFVVNDQNIAYSPSTGAPNPPTDNSEYEIIAYPAGSETGAVPIEDAEGKVVIVRRGNSTFHEKAAAAQESGAAGVIIDNNVAGAINATVEGDPAITIPTVTISMADGDAIRADLAAAEEPVTLTWSDQTEVSEIATGGLVSDFSSYGLSADLTVKPQVVAPGGFINSAYPLEAGPSGYATLSGTSMAAPHVAGAAALILEVNPELNPSQVLTSLQNTADPLLWSDNPDLGFPEPVHRQGAGMINIPNAIFVNLWGAQVTPSQINLYDNDTGASETHTLTIHNRDEVEFTYSFVNLAGIATAGINQLPNYYGAAATTEFSAETVTVPAGGTATVDVTITEPEGFAGGIYGGQIVVLGEDASGYTTRSIVSYGGLAGDYETDLAFMEQWTYRDYGYTEEEVGELIDEPIYSTPGLGVLEDCTKLVDGECVSEGNYSWGHDEYVYSMEDGDTPYAVLHIENPVSYMKIEAFHANADGTKGDPVSPDYNVVYESDGEGAVPGIQAYQWDGTYVKSADSEQYLKALDGDYVIEVTAVKGLGSIDNPDHVEVWTSPAFTIDRDGVPGEGPGDGSIDEEADKGFFLYNDFESAADHYFMYGRDGDEVFVGDWDGDGVDTIGVRRGHTFYVQNQLIGGNAEVEFKYGRDGDEILVGDWNADGYDTFAVRRGVTIYAQNQLIGGNAEVEFKYGREGDDLFAGDWDGDGYDTFAVRRGNSFYVQNSLVGGNAEDTFHFGHESDTVLVGDWDGDLKDTVALRRGDTFYVSNSLSSGSADRSFVLGRDSDEVLVGDWNGDGIDSVGLRR